MVHVQYTTGHASNALSSDTCTIFRNITLPYNWRDTEMVGNPMKNPAQNINIAHLHSVYSKHSDGDTN